MMRRDDDLIRRAAGAASLAVMQECPGGSGAGGIHGGRGSNVHDPPEVAEDAQRLRISGVAALTARVDGGASI
jgi:hypothetical protein